MHDAVGFWTNFHKRLSGAVRITDSNGVLLSGGGSKDGLIYGNNLTIGENATYDYAFLSITTENNVAEVIDFVVCGMIDDTTGHTVRQTWVGDEDITDLVQEIYGNVAA